MFNKSWKNIYKNVKINKEIMKKRNKIFNNKKKKIDSEKEKLMEKYISS